MKLKKLMIGMVLLSGIMLTACGNNQSQAGTSSGDKSSKSKDEKLLIYSNSVSDGRGEWLQEKAKDAGFDVEFVDLGANDLQNRILAEKEAPIADMILGLNQMNFEELKDEDLLVPFKPAWQNEIDPDVPVDKDGMFYPYSVQRVMLVYNKDKIASADAPKDFSDLYTKDAFKGKYAIASTLGGSTNNATFYTQIVNYQDKKGELGISKEGWNNIKAFYDNGYRTPEGESATANMIDGKIPFTMTFLSNIPQLEEKFSANIGVMNPPYGVPQLVEQIGILKKGKDTTTAEKFADWFGSADTQKEFAKEFSNMPANKDAQASVSDRLKEIMKETTPQDIDYNFVSEHLQDWIEYIELNIF